MKGVVEVNHLPSRAGPSIKGEQLGGFEEELITENIGLSQKM